MFPNASLMGFWWHTLFHHHIENLIAERLDMLPANKWVLVGTDAYMAEWSYGKLCIVREALANVLERRVREKRLSAKEALFIAERVLYKNAQELYGI
jgi:glucuronate isomerase